MDIRGFNGAQAHQRMQNKIGMAGSYKPYGTHMKQAIGTDGSNAIVAKHYAPGAFEGVSSPVDVVSLSSLDGSTSESFAKNGDLLRHCYGNKNLGISRESNCVDHNFPTDPKDSSLGHNLGSSESIINGIKNLTILELERDHKMHSGDLYF